MWNATLHYRWWCGALLGGCLVWPAVAAAQTTAASVVEDTVAAADAAGEAAVPLVGEADGARERLPEEVLVTGQRLFRDMERRIREAEDHMYALYNDLNDDDRYDFHCSWDQPTGTRIRVRNCRPQFLIQATSEQATNFLQTQQGFMGNGALPVMSVLEHHTPILEEKLKGFIRENDELLDAVVRHHELREELKARRSTYFGD